MECVLFIGLQGSGKSAFFKERFSDTHVRITLDMLKTRTREARFFELCLETGQRCVIDNTNPERAERARYLGAAKARGFKVVGYWFDVPVKDALARNAARPEKQRVPVPGVLRTAKIMQPPQRADGFDELFRAQIVEGRFVVEPFDGPVEV